jgi:hypothetical protein
VAQQHVGAAVVVVDEDAIDQAAHQHDPQTLATGSRPRRWLAPSAAVPDLYADRVRLGPERHLDDAGLLRVAVGVFDRVRRRLADG